MDYRMLCLLNGATTTTGFNTDLGEVSAADFNLTHGFAVVSAECDTAFNGFTAQLSVGIVGADSTDDSLIGGVCAGDVKELGLLRALAFCPEIEAGGAAFGAGDHGFFEGGSDQGLGFCGLSLGGLAEEVGQCDGREDANDGHNDHELNKGETLLESVFGGLASAGGHEPLHQTCFEDGGHEVTRPGRGCSTRPMSDGALLWGNRSGG